MWRTLITLQLLVPVLTLGCDTLGPRAIRQGRYLYNAGVQQTNSEQLLLNIVRLHYSDPPLFLRIAEIASTLTVRTHAGLTPAIHPDLSASAFGADVGVEITEQPTIRYIPLIGREYAEPFMRPINVGMLPLLVHAGWDLGLVLSLCVEHLEKGAFASISQTLDAKDRTSSLDLPPPTQEDEARLVDTLERLYRVDAIELYYPPTACGETTPALYFYRKAPVSDRDWDYLKENLGVNLELCSEYCLTFAQERMDNACGEIHVEMRPLWSIMRMLSHAVNPWGDHRGMSPQTSEEKRASVAIFGVNKARRRPQGARVAVRYRGDWYYLDEERPIVLDTFLLLAQLVDLQAVATPPLPSVLPIKSP